ncbi:MAG: vWA domain-containing protein [Ktedonobacterales bacterium]
MADETHESGASAPQSGRVHVTLEGRPDRRLIEPAGSVRHIDFHLQVSHVAVDASKPRTPLALSLVLDRSGSMHGEKLRMAKRAALSVLDQLDERDRVALVIFDDQVDTIQPATPVTPTIKAHAHAALARIEARGSTALHEGWLNGCNAIVEESASAGEHGIARCFLLTDGLANVGITDVEQIASQAGGIRHRAGVGTSTFGIGADYNEALLAQMAAAGGGEFYHLRTAEEIARTFIGELDELLGAAAGNARLEIETLPDVHMEPLGAYHLLPADGTRQSMAIGDLLSGEERHIIVRVGFPVRGAEDACPVRARVVWTADGSEYRTEWQELPFQYASHAACQAEHPDPTVMHWVWLDQAESAQREALRQSQNGDWRGAQMIAQAAAKAIAEHVDDDPDLRVLLDELQQLDTELERGPLPSLRSKEAYYRSQSRSRGKGGRDFRGPPQP